MQTFWDYYEQEIQPQIAAIDIFLKSEEPPYDKDIVGELLEIPPLEWQSLLQEEKISFITRGIFFQLMKRGNSPLCGMFRRATELYLPEAYTAEVIAYIFGLPIELVRRAAEELGQKTFTDALLPEVFSKISLAEIRFPF
ncbi:MAG: hypothetical protein IJY52_04645 [Anaerotignum sp.]|nr:hypothetical protein [Anaerotignum sp.]